MLRPQSSRRPSIARSAVENCSHWIAEGIEEGIAEGDVVLVGGRGLLRDGVRVEVAR